VSDPDPTRTEEQVRRLLADARHEEPMPAEVAERLDRVLADLQGDARRTSAPVDLAARRRRRIARNVLVAAAAVVVVGVGISRVDLGSPGDDDSGGSTAADAPQSMTEGEAGGDRGLLSLAGRPLVLHSGDFDQQVKRLRAGSTPNELGKTTDDAYADGLDDLDSGAMPARAWCDDPGWGPGRRVAVRYDGKRGVLVLRAPVAGTRVADLYLCGETAPTRSATVPAG